MHIPRPLRSGVTLIETIVVMVILTILASITIPLMNSTLTNYRLKKAGDIIRAEWIKLRIQAMEEGQIFCFRTMVGGNRILVDRVLDVHFTAALRIDDNYNSRRSETQGSLQYYEKDNFYSSGFSGEEEDFILRDPSSASSESGARWIQLPEGVFFADTAAIPDERAAYYLGFTVGEDDQNSRRDPVLQRDIRYGETKSQDGAVWSTPVFFFPDGTTSTAAVLLKNRSNRCLEVRIRGLTGTTTTGPAVPQDRYDGDLEYETQGMSQLELDAHPQPSVIEKH